MVVKRLEGNGNGIGTGTSPRCIDTEAWMGRIRTRTLHAGKLESLICFRKDPIMNELMKNTK